MRTSTLLVAAHSVAPYLLCAIGLLVLVAGAVALIGSPGHGYDYSAYDAAARRIASSQPLYLPDIAEAYNAGRYEDLYLYAPAAAVLLVPLTLLSPEAATLDRTAPDSRTRGLAPRSTFRLTRRDKDLIIGRCDYVTTSRRTMSSWNWGMAAGRRLRGQTGSKVALTVADA
jgi:hypothetical protein